MEGRIEDMSGAELLDHVGALGREQRECEVRILVAAVQHAILHNGDGVDPREAALPGREQARRYGGEGTPRVAEFAAAEFGARLGLTTYAGRELIADALDLAHRLPRLWRRVQALEVKASYARFVARKTRDLPVEQAAHVDGRVAESADGRIPWSRFEALVQAAVVAADPAAAAAREDAAATEQYARPARSDGHGMRGFYVRAPFAVIARLDATVAFVADALGHLGDTGSLDERRVKALLLLANPPRPPGCSRRTPPGRTGPVTRKVSGVSIRASFLGPTRPTGRAETSPTRPPETAIGPRSTGRGCCRR